MHKIYLLPLVMLTACSAQFHPDASAIAGKIDGSLGCKTFEDSLWSAFGEAIEKTGRPPSAGDVETALQAKLKNSSRLGKISVNGKTEVSKLTANIANIVIGRGIEALAAAKTAEKQAAGIDDSPVSPSDPDMQRGLWLERIAELEIGDRTTQAKSDDVDRVRAEIAQLKKLAESEGVSETACASPPPSGPVEDGASALSSMLDGWKTNQAPAVYGGLKTFATIYQSCDAATHVPLDKETSDVRGISVTGSHSSGGGNVRQITNKSAFLNSHPYVGNGIYKRPLPVCHDVQTTPSIYDYGGKPYSSTTNEKVLNLFRNGGTGSKELGIDCSALVYTAYASVGLKLKKETTLKASLVNGVSSTMLTDPKRNGLTCLDYASFTSKKSLLPGDIIAIKGHVVMVASVGSDPFGIASLTSASQCHSGNISIDDFNFNIFQSDPSKGGIGVNQMRARYYLSRLSTMGQGLIDYAVSACKAKFQTGVIVPKSSSASVVRHLGTRECSDPVPVQLTKEDCLSSCSARAVDPI